MAIYGNLAKFRELDVSEGRMLQVIGFVLQALPN
jgi:hypothetical protein